MLFAIGSLAVLTFIAFVLLPSSKKDWCLAIPVVGIGLALILGGLFVLGIVAYVGWTIHPLLGVVGAAFVLAFEIGFARLMLDDLCL